MRSTSERLLTVQDIRSLNFKGFDVPPTDEAIREVADYYVQAYGEVGIADIVWDASVGRSKDRGVNGEWIWC